MSHRSLFVADHSGPAHLSTSHPGIYQHVPEPTAMPTLRSQSYVFDARPHYPLLVSVKRYWVPGFESKDADAATLILAHATSFHKEHWEPVLEDLYDLVADCYVTNSPVPKIRDAWAIDSPNHGQSAVLNEETLLAGYTPTSEFYARPYHELLLNIRVQIFIDG